MSKHCSFPECCTCCLQWSQLPSWITCRSQGIYVCMQEKTPLSINPGYSYTYKLGLWYTYTCRRAMASYRKETHSLYRETQEALHLEIKMHGTKWCYRNTCLTCCDFQWPVQRSRHIQCTCILRIIYTFTCIYIIWVSQWFSSHINTHISKQECSFNPLCTHNVFACTKRKSLASYEMGIHVPLRRVDIMNIDKAML